MKRNFIRKFSSFLLAGLLLTGAHGLKAQCPEGCNSNYGFNSNNDAATIEYDNIVSASITTAIKETDGTFKIWGYGTAADGTSHSLSPQVINSTNYPGLQGTVLKVALGGVAGPNNQSVVLTTEGIYAWGTAGRFIPSSVQPNATFGRVSIPGSNAQDLPPGVEPQQVKSLVGTHTALTLLTCTGEAYVLTQNAAVAGAGLATANNSWNRVTTSEVGNPTLNNVIALRGSGNSLMALRADGTLWTWGGSSYLGDGTASIARNRATQMTLPNPAGTIKMIGMSSLSYYVLYTDGNLYATGFNSNKGLGDWTTTLKTTWVQPRYTSASGPVMNNVKWISPSEHNDSYFGINVITTDGQVYNWGQNYQSKLRSGGSPTATVDPGTPGIDKMLAVESGGAQTIVIKQCTQNFGFAGNQYFGSMGDGSGAVNVTRVPYNYSTAPVNICGVNAMITTGAPVFNAGLPTSRCQGAGTETYTATASGGTVSYTLSPAAAGSINASTGAVTYNAGWSGTAVITATATGGCGTPEAVTHSVIVSPTVGTPLFAAGATAERCGGATTTTYAATATAADSYNYTINNSGTGTQPTIDAATGAVSFAANWVGQSTITVQATGCGSTTTSSMVVTTKSVIANDDSYPVVIGVPYNFNVLTNDECGIDPSTVTIITGTSQGDLVQGANGAFTFTALGTFTGQLSFTYQVCNTGGTVCETATVTFDVTSAGNADPCSAANMDKLFYLPFPENPLQLKASLRSAGINTSPSNNTNNARSVISLSIPYPSTIIVYDHWEDGYEADINNPTQSTTQIWGDGNLSNGVAPGTITATTDLIPPGYTISLDNSFLYDRPASTVVYDGKDKVYTSNEVAITKFSGTVESFAIQAVKTNVLDVSKFGNYYTLPFGEDVPTKFGIATPVFKYTGLFVRAIENGTQVTISIPGTTTGTIYPASEYTSPVLNEGDVWYYGGTASNPGADPADVNKANDLRAGTTITSTKKFGVDVVFGGIDNFGTRNLPLYPAESFGNEYFTPVYSTSADNAAYAYFVNPNGVPITINWNRGNGTTGTFTVAANGGISRHQLNAATGTRYTSAGGQPFLGVVIVDDNNGTSLNYDWAYTMLPINRLTSFAKLGWAPGNFNNSANTNPVWVTAKEGTIVYVKNDGNITTGTTASPCGAFYDTAYPLTALQAQKIKIGNDNTGAAIFNCDGVPMSVAYGQEPGSPTPVSSPGLDVGYTVDGLCFKELVFAVDDYDTTGIGTPVTVNVAQNDAGFLTGLDPASVSTDFLLQPANGTIVVNPNGTITYTPNFGFTGDDTFEYRICANAPQGGACDVATVYIHVGCGFAADANIISGMIYNDLNSSLAADNGDSPKAGTVVNIYKDAGVIGTYEPGIDVLESSATSDADGKYSTSVTTLKNVKDEFNINAVNNSNGSENWTTSWTGTTFTTTSTTSPIIGSGYLQVVIGTAATQYAATRTVNLSGKSKAVLAYDWVKSAFTNDANDWVEVQVSANGSAPWTTLHKFTGLPGLTGSHSFVIPANLMSATTAIRFVEPNNSTTNPTSTPKYVRFDNVEVKLFEAANYIVKPANATPVSNPAQHTVSFTGSAQSDCDNNFGYTAINISGNVFNDADGDMVLDGGEKPVSGNNTDNGGTSVVTGGSLYANLVDENGQVLQSVQVNADGSYAFTPVEGNLPYKVVLTTTAQAVNTVLTTGTGPSGWLATGTSLDGTPTVGNTTYVIDLGTVTADVDDADYGIQRPPVADPKTYTVANTAFSTTPPAGGYPVVPNYQSIPASSSALTGYPTGGSLSGSDPEDCATAGSCNTQGSTTFEITAINSNTKLFYDFGAGPVEIIVAPNDTVSIPNFDVTKLVVYGANGSGTTADPFGFTYAITDNAGVTSPAVPYTIATSSPLPVTLISFDAKREGSTVNLKWTTASEQNSKGFEIQRSADARNWKDLGFVPVKSENGNSTSTLNYGFTDDAPLTGTSYYRLKMVDLDGSFGYSNIRSVDMEGGMAEVTLFPNPASSQLLLKDVNTSLAVSVTVVNAAGVEVYTSTSNFKSVDVSRLPEGLYVLVVKQTGGNQTVRKFVVKK